MLMTGTVALLGRHLDFKELMSSKRRGGLNGRGAVFTFENNTFDTIVR